MINQILNFLTEHTSDIINLALVIATVLMVNETRKSVNESIKSREESNSAEVIAYIKAEYHRMYIVIENVGPTIATNIKINTDKPLINSQGKTFKDLKEIESLPPNYPIKTYFDETYSYKEKFMMNFLTLNSKLSLPTYTGKSFHENIIPI